MGLLWRLLSGIRACHGGSSRWCRETTGNGTRALPPQGMTVDAQCQGKRTMSSSATEISWPERGIRGDPAVSLLVLTPLLTPTLPILCPPILCCRHLGAMRWEKHVKNISRGQKMRLLSLKKQRRLSEALYTPLMDKAGGHQALDTRPHPQVASITTVQRLTKNPSLERHFSLKGNLRGSDAWKVMKTFLMEKLIKRRRETHEPCGGVQAQGPGQAEAFSQG